MGIPLSIAYPCHSERSEESPVFGFRFFTPFCSVQNDIVRLSPFAERKGVRGMLACHPRAAPASPAVSLRSPPCASRGADVPPLPTLLDSGFRRNDGNCARHPCGRSLQRREVHRQQQLVCLRERGDTAGRGPDAFGARLLADSGPLVVALVRPHVDPSVECA